MKPKRTFLYKLMLAVVGAALVTGGLLVGGVVFILVSVSMHNPKDREVMNFELQTVSEVYVRNRTRSQLMLTVHMPKDELPGFMARFRQTNPSLYKAVTTRPVAGQPDSIDVVQVVAADSSMLLVRRRSGYHYNHDEAEPATHQDEGIYQPAEIVNGPHPFTLRPTVQWVDGQHQIHTQQLTMAEINKGLAPNSVAGSARKPKTVRYLDYR